MVLKSNSNFYKAKNTIQRKNKIHNHQFSRAGMFLTVSIRRIYDVSPKFTAAKLLSQGADTSFKNSVSFYLVSSFIASLTKYKLFEDKNHVL